MRNKKVSLITIHTGPNFGTILQVIASNVILKNHGFDVTVVNYIPPRDSYKRIYDDTINSVKLSSGLSKIKRILGGIRRYFKVKESNSIYIGTLKKYCVLSAPIYYNDDFRKKCPIAEYYVTGSDQVWNTIHNEGIDNHYFFRGVSGVKIALSASIGMDTLSDIEKKEFYDYLSEYKAISVREQKAVELLKGINIRSVQVLDPTLMLDREKWSVTVNPRNLINKPYLLVYIPYNIHDKDMIYKFARRVAKEKGLVVITFTWSNVHDSYADLTMKNVGPIDFLSLMYYADYVITNSFHGTAFSINLNRNFWVYMPTHFTSRIESILNLCGLSDRIIDDDGITRKIDDTIDYERVNSILNKERDRFHQFINDNMK